MSERLRNPYLWAFVVAWLSGSALFVLVFDGNAPASLAVALSGAVVVSILVAALRRWASRGA